MVVFSRFYTSEASLTHIIFVSALKIVKNPISSLNMIFWGGPFFLFRGTNPRSGNLGPVPPWNRDLLSLSLAL